jgi:hypothetical protein
MSNLDDDLRTLLHGYAGEQGAAVDLVSAWDELDARLDRSRAARTRNRWGVAVAAAAAVALVAGALVTLHGRDSTMPPVDPTRSLVPWTGGSTQGKPSLGIPSWTTSAKPAVLGDTLVSWAQDSCRTACPEGKDRKLTVLVAQAVADRGTGGTSLLFGSGLPYSGYSASIEALRGTPGITMSRWNFVQTAQTLTAITVSITASRDVAGALGCPGLGAVGDCESLWAGTRTALAVVDIGHLPMAIWTTENSGADAEAQDAELRAMVESLRLTGLPSSCTSIMPDPLVRTDCLPDLWRRIERDSWIASHGKDLTQGQVDAVWGTYAVQMGEPGGYPGAWSYARGPGFDPTSTRDWTAVWTLSGTSTTGHVCMAGQNVVIQPDHC